MLALVAEDEIEDLNDDLSDLANNVLELQRQVSTNDEILAEMVGALTELEFGVTQAQRGGVTYADLEGLGRELDRVGRCVDDIVFAVRNNASIPPVCI